LRGELRSEDSGTSSMRVIRVFGVKVSETSVLRLDQEIDNGLTWLRWF